MKKSYGKNFVVFRRLVGLKQKDAAKKLGIDSPLLCNYEHDKTRPSFETLKAMSKLYGTTIDELLNIGE